MPQSTRTFRVFISSTFSDLKAERNALQQKVFPRLRELAMAHGCRFQAIDLRWGVSEEAGLDQKTMRICLTEVERCQKTSPRPNFLILLGDRYGWCPLPEEIPADEYEEIDGVISVDGRGLLNRWYRLDENAVPPVYCLLPRSPKFEDYQTWEQVERKLRSTLLGAVDTLAFSADKKVKYITSATEQEIVVGAMRVADAQGHVFAFFRQIEGLPEVETSKDYRSADRGAWRMQVELKERLKEQLSGNVHEYLAYWQGEEPSLDHLDQLCDDVYAELSRVMLAETARLEAFDALDKEITSHDSFGKDRARVFVGRENLQKSVAAYLKRNDPHPLVAWGPSGAGKSALMARLVQQAQATNQAVVCRFIGATPESSNGRALLESLCRQVSRLYGADDANIPSEYKDLVPELPKRLALAKPNKPLVLFLDALDQISDADKADRLGWLPWELPPHVHLVVSSLPGAPLQDLLGKIPAANRLDVQPMSLAEGKAILNCWLAEAGRRLDEKQEEYVLDKFGQCGLPLYLRLAFEEARLWKSADPLPDLGYSIPDLLSDLFGRLSQEANHGKVLVARSLGYLAAAKHGLSEDELLDILSRDREILADFKRRSPKSPAIDHLPVVIWSRLYQDLEPYLAWRHADGTELLTFYHRQLRETVEALYCSGAEKTACHKDLAGYFGEEKRSFWINRGQRLPDRRKTSEVAYQQAHAGLETELKKTLTAFDFLQARLCASGVGEVIRDFDLALGHPMALRDGNGCHLIQEGLRLSAHILGKDTDQLATQLLGRMMTFPSPDIQDLLRQAVEWPDRPWFRPLTACLTPPGGAEQLTFAGHDDHVTAVAVSRDGRLAVSGGGSSHYDGRSSFPLKVWDLEMGREKLTLTGHPKMANCVAITPDGRLAVSGSVDDTLKVWDLDSGREQLTLKGHSRSVNAVAISSDGCFAISGSQDATLRVWDLKTGRHRMTLKGHSGYVNAVAISPDGRLAVSGSADTTLKVWDLKIGKEQHTLKGHTDLVYAVAIAPDGRYAVSGSQDRTLKIWDLKTGKERFTLVGHIAEINAVAVSPDGRWVVSGGGYPDRSIRVWDLETASLRYTFTGHTGGVLAVAVRPDSKFVLSGSEDKTLKVWNLEAPIEPIRLPGHSDSIPGVAVSPDGKVAVSGSADKTVKVWDLETGAERFVFTGHHDRLSRTIITPDGRNVVSHSTDNVIKVWDIDTGAERFTLSGYGPLAITPDGRLLLIARIKDKTIRVYDLGNGAERFILAGHKNDVLAVAVGPDSRMALSASRDKTLKVWDLESGRERFTLGGHTDDVWDVAINPDGRLAVSASGDRTLKVWDLTLGREVLTLNGHDRRVSRVAITPDGLRAVSGSDDFSLKVWDLKVGKNQHTLDGHRAQINYIAITPDGRLAVSASMDNTLKAWDMQRGECVASYYAEIMMGYSPVFRADPFSMIVGDASGRMHFLRMQNFTLEDPVVTAWSEAPSRWKFWQTPPLAYGCPYCRAWAEVTKPLLGAQTRCPKCGKFVRLNPFTIEGDWRPLSAVWKNQSG